MSKPRTLQAVLTNVLGTLLSRNSNSSGGFWLLGLAESELQGWRGDLLLEPTSAPVPATPIDELRGLAAHRFREQLGKARIAFASVAQAEIWVASVSEPVTEVAGDAHRQGRLFRFAASAMTVNGARYRAEWTVFVAPHDPSVERSNKRSEGT